MDRDVHLMCVCVCVNIIENKAFTVNGNNRENFDFTQVIATNFIIAYSFTNNFGLSLLIR